MPNFDPLMSLANMRHEFGEHGGVNMSISASTTYTVMDPHTMPEIFRGRRGPDEGGCFLYGRHFNPTVYVLGREIAALEGTESGYCTASGMAAISGALTQICNTGDHIVASNTLYGGTFALLNEYFPKKMGVHTTFVDITDLGAVRAAFQSGTRVLYAESLSNPTFRVADIPQLAELAHEHNVKLVIDNTFTPLMLSPAQLGADIVVHSLTKFINGASDIIAGAICATREFIGELMDLHTGSLMLLGPTLDPKIASHMSLRLPHLGIRMVEHSRRALLFSERLENLGLNVNYPGLARHKEHALFKSMANSSFGYGGLLTLDAGSRERAEALMGHLQNDSQFGFLAVSLGYFETLMSCSASSTSSELTDEELQRAGISPGLVRFSIGFTGSAEQRWEQFHAALRAVDMV